ncbi:MAG: site-specific DNA-methyltransferase [Gemmatimonadetes bacterium]|nr:site-specific DNA-methyltransferase [Gemmatimonadota bacterium]
MTATLAAQRRAASVVGYQLHHGDALDWLASADRCSIQAVVTDPPYGVVEYTPSQLDKRRNGNGGVWRLPPSFDGATRQPVPRFTVLTEAERAAVREFFAVFAERLLPVLVPGAHLFVATTPVVSHLLYEPLVAAGFEKRGEIVRIVKTLRGGDRPKNAHEDYPDVSVMPRACWEPWGLFRKPIEGRVSDNLRRYGTGGLRRISGDTPFRDLIECGPARRTERDIAPHPSLKPQALMRQLVHASLPLGTGTVLDPFCGSGATLAAAEALGIASVGVECDRGFYDLATEAIPRLAALDAPPRL